MLRAMDSGFCGVSHAFWPVSHAGWVSLLWIICNAVTIVLDPDLLCGTCGLRKPNVQISLDVWDKILREVLQLDVDFKHHRSGSM